MTQQTIEVKVPTLPESVADATIAAWHKKIGDKVMRDENLLDLETDKVVLEVPAPQSGVLQSIAFQAGTTVTSGQVLATIAPLEDGATKSTPAEPKENNKKSEPATGPAVRRALAEHGVTLQQVAPAGNPERVTKADVDLAIQKPNKTIGHREEQRVPMTRLRAKIAERLLSSQHNAAILTTFNEVNLQNVMNLRKQYQDIFEKKHGVRIGFMSFFTKAVIEALKKFPAVNASIEDQDIIYHGYYDIGIAVSTERGLVVPVLRDADQMEMATIEKTINQYAAKARDGKLAVEEMQGGTFTITNGGVFGSLLSTPIINPPQSAILGMHKIQERPVVENGQIVIRPMMYLALSYDHRLIDGKDSVQFLVTVKEMLEDPARMILHI
jgi:2-oxoglutarate dehydrogenase E2 component (dihydrolipoamide succinyltransferase)